MKKIKNLISPLLCIAMITSVLVGCKDNKATQDNTHTLEEKVVEDVKPPEQIISNKEAKVLFDDYSRNVVSVLQNNDDDDDDSYKPARFAEYDLETIKQYIAYVEQEAKQANKTKVASLRFYFGKYPKGEKSGKNTMFIVPTTKFEGAEDNQGFYIEVSDDGKKVATPISNSIKQNEQGMGNIKEKNGKSYAAMLPLPAVLSTNATYFEKLSLTMNHGGAGPPPNTDY
ncbi:MAG: hypothetical protein COA50_11915 [Flavobacteriaceae bacterium]|nr:MAG: hypothetical protein COA50_11915 [Flavobacteriaceae bacterium]